MSHGADDYPAQHVPLDTETYNALRVDLIGSKEGLRRYAQAWIRSEKHFHGIEDGFLNRAKLELMPGIQSRLPFGSKLYLHFCGGVLDPPETVNARFVITADQQSTTYQLTLERQVPRATINEI